jgi:hypothetical protein
VLERVKGKVYEDGRLEEFIYGMVAVRVCSTLVHFITMVHQNHLNNFRPTVFPKFFSIVSVTIDHILFSRNQNHGLVTEHSTVGTLGRGTVM